MYAYMYILNFTTYFVATQLLIAPQGPHCFIPSREGPSPSPFSPLNARGCVREPPVEAPCHTFRTFSAMCNVYMPAPPRFFFFFCLL